VRVPRLVAVVTAVVVVLAGCGSQGDAGGAAPTESSSSSGTPGSSPSSSGSPSAPSGEARERAASATKKALLPDSAFEKIGMEVDSAPKEDKWDWFDSCRPYLPSEARQVTGHHARWKGDGMVISQTVVAYPDGVAEDIVAEVKKAVTCTEFSAGQSQYTKVGPVSLPKDISQPDAAHAWCMQKSDGDEVCHSVIAQQDLVSTIWTKAKGRDEALDALAVTTALAAKRIDVQIR
jgi:hypothetical protein